MPTVVEQQLSVERARVRDLLRYYKPSLKRPQPPIQHGALLEICDTPEALSDAPSPSIAITAEAADDPPDDSHLLSHDPTLTAFAQLGAFRLNCQRSFISLMDHENQFILAEATRSVSLNDQKVCDTGDEVYLGPRVLDMVWGVCPNTIQVFTAKDAHLNIETDMIVANQESYVMNDLSAIAAYKDRPYVAGWPHMRFYAEVPIHSPTGHVIGTYCVVDDKPREGLDKKGLDALNEIASAIMKHLELIQMQHNLQRAGEMVKGLGVFVEGKSAPTHQWLHGDGDGMKPLKGRPVMSRIGTAETLSTVSDYRVSVQNSNHPQPYPSNPSSVSEALDEAITISNYPKSSFTSDATAHSREHKMTTHDGKMMSESLASNGTKKLFSRASSLIREALDLDGILFVDAFLQSNIIETMNPAPMSSESVRNKGVSDTPVADKIQWLDFKNTTPVAANPFGGHDSAGSDPHRRSSTSELLGYSTQNSAFLASQSSPSRFVPLPQSTLHGLLRKYGHGHTFVFDEEGLIVHDSNETNEVQNLEGKDCAAANLDLETENSWTKQLLDICTGARSIIFFPIWDPQRDVWFAGSLAWTSDPSRIIQSADVTYLAAFGSCIMSEKSRLDALTADRAKADFISSVSHELRSPLHGVLASAEALQETSTGLVQDDMIRTITICGDVLLDTMDQILDYAKTSNSADPARLKQKLDSHPKKPSPLDLGVLVESVMEGAFVGHNYRKKSFRSLNGRSQRNGEASKTVTVVKDNVVIVLDIEWQVSWVLESHSGDWKRILMNLFGNSLKYTQSGFVHVSLKSMVSPATTKGVPQQIITLRVDDSGKGMSKDYLKYQLFTPFAQEDQMAMGTGLGLSIVRQLVTDLRGTIDFQSDVGHGTTVIVTVPVKPATLQSLEPISLDDSAFVSGIGRQCKGLTICLVGFEYHGPDLEEIPTGILNAAARAMLALKASIEAMASTWFGMKVSTASSLSSARGDILLTLQSKLELLDGHVQEQALIVFDDAPDGGRLRHTAGIVYVSQPVGPQKMAHALALCLEHNASVTDRYLRHDETGSIEIRPSAEIPSGNSKPLGKAATYALNDGHSTNGLPDMLAGIDKSKQSPSFPPSEKSLQQQAAASTTDETILTLRYPESSTKSLQRSKVLLVEDNVINMKILVQYMQKAERDYITASNGLEALQIFQADPSSFGVIFMDLSMPIMDGLTSSRNIRAHELRNSLPRTRIVALTCFSSPEYQRDAMLSGVDMFLIKPVPMKTLKPILDLDPRSFPWG